MDSKRNSQFTFSLICFAIANPNSKFRPQFSEQFEIVARRVESKNGRCYKWKSIGWTFYWKWTKIRCTHINLFLTVEFYDLFTKVLFFVRIFQVFRLFFDCTSPCFSRQRRLSFGLVRSWTSFRKRNPRGSKEPRAASQFSKETKRRSAWKAEFLVKQKNSLYFNF